MHEFGITLLSGLLLILLLLAAWHDVRSYRIPNLLVLSGIVIGILLNTFLPQVMGGIGFLSAFMGLGAGLLVLMPLYLLRAMGAGDVKLMAMVGAFVGPVAMLWVTIYVLIAGGLLAIGISLLRGRLTQVFDNLKLTLLLGMTRSPQWRAPIEAAATQADHRLPYGVAIASGTIVYLLTV